jgi:hypothetical protein
MLPGASRVKTGTDMAYDTFTRPDLGEGIRPADDYAPRGAVRVIVTDSTDLARPAVKVDFSAKDKGALIYWNGERPSVDVMNKARAAAGLAPLAQWQIEFEDQASDQMPTIPAGFEDHSWHNDMCPRFESEALSLSLWIDHSDPEKREWPEMDRFTIYEGTSFTEHMNDEPTLATSDWSDVVAFIAKREGRDAKAARLQYLAELATAAAEIAADAMALHIQRALGVQSGDLAGIFFSGSDVEGLATVARQYIEAERDSAEAAREAEG